MQYDGRNYFASVNAHMGLQGEMPSVELLSQALNEEYSDFKRVLKRALEPRAGQ